MMRIRRKKPDFETLTEEIIKQLRTIFDPEIPVNIYDLGLIYDIKIHNYHVHIQMTLTSPGCPVAQTFPRAVENSIKQVKNVRDCIVELVWDPPWSQERMTEATRLELGLFY